MAKKPEAREASIPCALGRIQPTQMDVEEVKREGWRDHGIAVFNITDPRIGWIERQVIDQLASKFYGKRTDGK